MQAGVWILNIFAAVWGAVGLAAFGAPIWAWAAPALLSLAVGAYSASLSGRQPARGPDDGRRIGRLVGIWSSVEGVAILIAVNVVRMAGLTRFTAPVVGVIVGLHFIPLARGIPYKAYYFTGAALIAVSLASVPLPGVYSQAVTGVGCMLVLWFSSIVLAHAAGRRSTEAAA